LQEAAPIPDSADLSVAFTQVAMEGFLSNANYSTKRLTLVLFINNRLVECSPIRRCLEGIYQSYLPKVCTRARPMLGLGLLPFRHLAHMLTPGPD
jgi:DNA mismatch repair ATPase MutL